MDGQNIRRRETNGLTLLFYSHEELILKSPSGTYIFHAWFCETAAQRRAAFRPFRKALMHRRLITTSYVFRLASEHDVYYVHDKYDKAARLLANVSKELPENGERKHKR